MQRVLTAGGRYGKAARVTFAAMVMATTLMFFNGGDADAHRKNEWYPCYIPDYGWMWCMDIE